MLARIIQYFTRNPKKLFLTDAIGAIVTALSWLIWKLLFAEQFKFHSDVLSGLIFYAIALFCASMQFYLFAKRDFSRCINFLIFGNTGFVLIVLSLLYYFWIEISFLPKIYMLLECIIVSNLVYLEFKVKENLRN
jgi:hypothetical protein